MSIVSVVQETPADPLPPNVATTDTAQTITGDKIFAGDVIVSGDLRIAAWEDVASYADQANPIQSALNALPSRGGLVIDTRAGDVLSSPGVIIGDGKRLQLPSRGYDLSGTFVDRQRAHLVGQAAGHRGEPGTTLKPASNFNGDLVSCDTGSTSYWERGLIENIGLDGLKTTVGLVGYGLKVNAFGECSEIRNVFVRDFKKTNVAIWGGSVPANLQGVSSFGSDEHGYEVADTVQDIDFIRCGGDGNALSLFRFVNMSQAQQTVNIIGGKSERPTWAPTAHNPVIQLENFNAKLNVVGLSCYIASGVAGGGRIIRVINTTGDRHINVLGLAHNGYTNLIEDGTRTVPTEGRPIMSYTYDGGGAAQLAHQEVRIGGLFPKVSWRRQADFTQFAELVAAIAENKMYLSMAGAGRLQILGENTATELAEITGTIASGETALLLRRNVGGALSLQRVSMGAVDSGGAGFKVLRVPN